MTSSSSSSGGGQQSFACASLLIAATWASRSFLLLVAMTEAMTKVCRLTGAVSMVLVVASSIVWV